MQDEVTIEDHLLPKQGRQSHSTRRSTSIIDLDPNEVYASLVRRKTFVLAPMRFIEGLPHCSGGIRVCLVPSRGSAFRPGRDYNVINDP
jgi:hypothetical protein